MARYSATEQTYRAMSDEELMDLWVRLFTFMQEAPRYYPVQKWNYGDLDIWPMLRGVILLRAVRIFLNRQFDLLHVQDAADVNNSPLKYFEQKKKTPSPFRLESLGSARCKALAAINKKAVVELEARTRLVNELPVDHADVLCFAAKMACSPYGRYYVQQHLDPLRISLGEKGISSFCYVTDHDESEAFDLPFLLEGVAGFKTAFGKIQCGLQPDHVLDTSLLNDFDKFWTTASRIVPLDFLITDQTLQNIYKRIYSAKRMLYQFFKFRQTKAVALYAYYGILGWAAASAARRLGIATIDVQHGVEAPGHESYDFENMPASGYNVLPTHFLCWSAEEATALNRQAKGHFKAYSIGHSWKLVEAIMASDRGFRILPADRIEDARVSLLDKRQALLFPRANFEVAQNREKRVFQILLALQDEKDLDWIDDLIESKPPHWWVYLRMHPASVGKKDVFAAFVAKYQQTGVNVREASTAPLDLLLPRMDVVVTHYSSTILDGHAFGKPGICYGAAGRWYFSWMGEQGPMICKQSALALDRCLQQIEERQEIHRVAADRPPLEACARVVGDLFPETRS